jgi:hypothetical protein
MQTIYLDISNKGIIPTINAKQNDVGRKFCVLLFENGISYNAEGDKFSLWYAGESGEGNYDEVISPDLFSVSNNHVIVELSPQMLSKPGDGNLCLTISDNEDRTIGLWNIPYFVEELPGVQSEQKKPYYPRIVRTVNGVAPDETGNVVVRTVDSDVVLYTQQNLSADQQSQARANIDALQVPVAKEVTREEIAWVEFDDFSDQDSRPIYTQAGALDWLQSADDFDFRLITQNDGVVYELTKADCEMVEETYESGKMWYFLTKSPDGVSWGYPLIVANGVNQLTEEPEDSYSFSYMGFTPEGDYPNLWFYRLTTTERKLRVVTSVNGVEPDENGNVELEVGGGSGNVYIGPEQPTDGTLYWLDTSGEIVETVEYAVTANLSHVTSDNNSATVNEGESYAAALTAEDGYVLADVSITMGGTDITATSYANGNIYIASVTGDIVITAAATEVTTNAYSVTNNLVNVTSNNSAVSVQENASYSATLTAAEGYELDSVTVTMGGVDVTTDVYADGVINITAVTGDVVITATVKESLGETVEMTYNPDCYGTAYSDAGETTLASVQRGGYYSAKFEEETTLNISLEVNSYQSCYVGYGDGYAYRKAHAYNATKYEGGTYELEYTIPAGKCLLVIGCYQSHAVPTVYKKG